MIWKIMADKTEKIWKIRKKMVKRFGKYGRKVSWILKWIRKYGRKTSWIVKRYGKYGRKDGKDMKNTE
jgi:hypothetical protein